MALPPREPPWYDLIETVKPHVVRILTPRGRGTGFLFYRSSSGGLIGIATAAHVIEDSHYWGEPIRIQQSPSTETVLLRENDRAVFVDAKKDSAAILLDAKKLSLPPALLSLVSADRFVRVGVEIGWLGFPAIPRADLCFFHGSISAHLAAEASYLVDGVAINGVSGGPAFLYLGTATVMGILSAYIPNRATGELLPGLAVVRDVSPFHDLLQRFKSLDEAKEEETPVSEVNPPTTSSPPPNVDEPNPATPTKRAM